MSGMGEEIILKSWKKTKDMKFVLQNLCDSPGKSVGEWTTQRKEGLLSKGSKGDM